MNLLGDSDCIFLMLKKIMTRMIRKTIASMTTIMVARPVGRLQRMWLKSVDTPTPVTYPLSQKKPGVVFISHHALIIIIDISLYVHINISSYIHLLRRNLMLFYQLCSDHHHCHQVKHHRHSYNSHQSHHLLSEVPSGQEHHEVRPRNLAEALRVILVEQGAPPDNISFE